MLGVMAQKTSARDVIEALGGTTAVAELTGNRFLSAVSNWSKAGAFPPNTYIVLSEALAAKGHEAPVSLWGMKERAESSVQPALEPERQAP
jgi:hypothetical protein